MNFAMRALLVLVLAGCTGQLAPDAIGGNKGIGGNGSGSGSGSGGQGTPAQCFVDTDCVAAGPKCCDCPTLAVPKDDPLVQACKDVVCPPPMCPQTDLAPACMNGTCVLACAQISCTTTCADGYALDSNGCLTCTCDQITTRSCGADTDCVETRADCCGCMQGGSDTAVAKSDQAAFDASLMCPPSPQCPPVDTCNAADLPRCIEGSCLLTTATPAGACGRSDLPACTTGQTCVVNANADATDQHVGVCM